MRYLMVKLWLKRIVLGVLALLLLAVLAHLG